MTSSACRRSVSAVLALTVVGATHSPSRKNIAEPFKGADGGDALAVDVAHGVQQEKEGGGPPGWLTASVIAAIGWPTMLDQGLSGPNRTLTNGQRSTIDQSRYPLSQMESGTPNVPVGTRAAEEIIRDPASPCTSLPFRNQKSLSSQRYAVLTSPGARH
jgi:hypothetical protein